MTSIALTLVVTSASTTKVKVLVRFERMFVMLAHDRYASNPD